MVSSVTCWCDVLVWEGENIWWFPSAICPYRCAKRIVHWIGSHIVRKWERYDLSSPIVLYVRICVSNEVADGIAYCTSMSRLHITPYMNMLIHVQHREQTIQSISSLFPFPYMMKSYDVFLKFHVCKHILSAYYKWFLVESTFNIFIFKLNDFNMDVHLCLKYVTSIVLI